MIYADGFSNNLESGYTVTDEHGNLLARRVFPYRITCNEAELQGILRAAQFAEHGDYIVTDSKIAKTWASFGSSKARPDLQFLAGSAHELIRAKKLTVIWQPREFNKAGIYNEGSHPTHHGE